MKFIKRTQNPDTLKALPSMSSFKADVLSSRLTPEQINAVLSPFDINSVSPFDLPEMDKAVGILLDVVDTDAKVACVVDYDTDGISSGSVLIEGLSSLGINVGVMVTDRYADGYGFSEGACDKILELPELPDVLITADLGSSDGIQIKRLQNAAKAQGKQIKVIVTDHHHISATTPPSTADAFVNPGRKDVPNRFSHNICGAAVAWMLVKALSQKVFSMFDPMELIDYVGIATVGDMMPLTDPLNRAFVISGLELMNSKHSRPCWTLFKQNQTSQFTEDTIGFQVSPRINALSRMGDDGRNALEWLTSRDFYTVEAAFNNMEINNEERKDEQLECQRQALAQAKEQVESGYFLCVCYVPNFTHGVVGLAASHVMQETGLPAIVLSKKDSGDITGSARSIPGFDLRGVIEAAQNECGVLTKFGGHTMAAGMSMRSDMDIPVFRETINDIAQRVFNGQQPEPIFYHDGDLPSSLLNVDSLQSLLALGPFGQEFPAPSFFVEGRVKSVKFMGKDKAHAKLALSSGQEIVWFRHEGKANGIEGKTAKSVVSLSINEFRGNRTVQLLNQAIQFES